MREPAHRFAGHGTFDLVGRSAQSGGCAHAALYAPVGGDLVQRNFADRTVQPTAATLPEWPQAKALAARFWAEASADPRISSGFRQIAAENLSQMSV